jgi:hypothetical protein
LGSVENLLVHPKELVMQTSNIIVARPEEAAANLAQLAREINAAHKRVEKGVRDVLSHARAVGTLLIQAKARLGHGNFLPWVRANCGFTERTGQRYMKLAEHWHELVARGGDELGLAQALRLLTRRTESGNAPDTTTASHLPAPLAYYRDRGLISDEATVQLERLAEDYGADFLTSIIFDVDPDTVSAEWTLNALRPLECPRLWPQVAFHHLRQAGANETTGARTVVEATRIFLTDGRARKGQVPEWEVTAFWFASTLVYLADQMRGFPKDFTAILERELSSWRESFRIALVMVTLSDDSEEDAERAWDWIGYAIDLHHAGVAHVLDEVSTDVSAYPGLQRSIDEGLAEWKRVGSYPAPSARQGRIKHVESQPDEDLEP